MEGLGRSRQGKEVNKKKPKWKWRGLSALHILVPPVPSVQNHLHCGHFQHSQMGTALGPVSVNFPFSFFKIKSLRVNSLGFGSPMVSITTTQLCCCTMNTAMHSACMSGCGCVLIKLYLQKQMVVLSRTMGHIF
jgi:hypothetical protein